LKILSRVDIIVIFLVIAALSTGTYIRNRVWNDHVLFWEHTVRLSPNKARPHFGVARAYIDRNGPGDVQRAIDHVWRACQIRPECLELFKDAEDIDWEKARAIKDWGR
jgi:hypothetical protein